MCCRSVISCLNGCASCHDRTAKYKIKCWHCPKGQPLTEKLFSIAVLIHFLSHFVQCRAVEVAGHSAGGGAAPSSDTQNSAEPFCPQSQADGSPSVLLWHCAFLYEDGSGKKWKDPTEACMSWKDAESNRAPLSQPQDICSWDEIIE